MALVTLKKRAEFLRLRGGARCATPAFVLETKPRVLEGPSGEAGPRFGFTVTKKIGGAVVRNRIRRRLKAAIEAAAAGGRAAPNHDYVIIAREPAASRPFEDLKKDFERAFRRVHQPGAASPKAR